jgi:chemotaxis protein CheZ
MPPLRKIFRIEEMAIADASPAGEITVPPASALDADAVLRHLEIVNEVRAVRDLIRGRAQDAQRLVETLQAQLGEIHKLKAELDLIQHAIVQTKQEIATIHINGFGGPQLSRVANELDAVVVGTEQATQSILGAVEEIDRNAETLAAGATSEQDRQLAHEIRDRVVQIFEACNFQDLTGQRITKVVTTFKFIENHIRRMMEIWGGMEAIKSFAPSGAKLASPQDDLLHGPKLDSDEGHVSQDDIDALFD